MRTSTALVFATPLLIIIVDVSLGYLDLIPGSMNQILIYASFLISIIGLVLAVIERNENRRKKSKEREKEALIKRRIENYFIKFDQDVSKIRTIESDISQSEDKIVKELLAKALVKPSNNYLNSLVLGYFCKKYDESRDPDPEDLSNIRNYSEVIGIGSNSDGVITFQRIYNYLFNIAVNQEVNLFQNVFISKYLTERRFEYITEELHQSKNFVSTLRKIIKEGKLSTWGIKEEMVSRIETELRLSAQFSGSYFVLGQNVRGSIRDYIDTLEQFRGTQKIEGMSFSTQIVKVPSSMTTKDFLGEIKKNYKNDQDSILWAIPINLLENEEFTFPADRSFTNHNVNRSYKLFTDFMKVGTSIDATAIWSVIKKSRITVNELLSVIPFNILCPGITTSESDFIITHYNNIKEILDITALTDFRKEDPEQLARILVKLGQPEYHPDEINSLGLKLPLSPEDLFNRFQDLTKDIVNNSGNFWNALEGF